MCGQCHQGMPDDVVVQQLKDALKNPQYEMWNSTSLSHMSLAAMGVNGVEASRLGRNLLVRYIKWSEQGFLMNLLLGQNEMNTLAKELLKSSDKKRAEFNREGLTTEQIKERVFHSGPKS